MSIMVTSYYTILSLLAQPNKTDWYRGICDSQSKFQPYMMGSHWMTDGAGNHSCEVKLTVPFHDLDPLQMVWHGNYLKYFDIARTELFTSSGLDLFDYFKETNYLFPITKTSTKHIVSLRYRDEFRCKATCIEAQFKIIIEFKIRLVKNNQICAKGISEQVAVKYPEMEMMFEIPQDIRKALGFFK